jgi:uncharacterized protein
MKHRRQLTLLALICAGLVGSYYAPSATRATPSIRIPSPDRPPAARPTVDVEIPTRYFFDVYGHTDAEIMALLDRARDTYDKLPPEFQDSARIAMVLHGPDVAFFASDKYEQYKDLVDLAAKLDAFGFVDFKVCAVSARRNGLQSDSFPSFIELVPYGPAEVSRLEAAGYLQL